MSMQCCVPDDTHPFLPALLEHIQTHLPTDQAALLGDFARCFFAQADAEDLTDRESADLFGALLSQWRFIQDFSTAGDGDTPSRIKVFNPRLADHGWESPHTVVQILSRDMPFLVDSVVMEVNRQGLTLHRVIHPVLRIRRDASGKLQAVGESCPCGGETTVPGRFESLMYIEVDRRTDPADLDALQWGLGHVLNDVRLAVDDWPAMRQRLADMVAEIESRPVSINPAVNAEETAEAIAFLRWLLDDNFVLLGCRDYDLKVSDQDIALHTRAGTGLGILRAGEGEHQSLSFAALAPGLKSLALHPTLLTFTKSNTRSSVHRPGYLDYVGVRSFDADGRVIGERRILGLLTSVAYHASPSRIPLLRRKVAAVQQQAGCMPGSHAAKALATLLEQYPRDELFQIEVEQLLEHALIILRLGERQRFRLLLRHDSFGRYVSCLMFVPREIYNTEQRQRIQSVLQETFNGSAAEFDVQFSGSALARILVMVRTPSGIPDYDAKDLEARLIRAIRRWRDDLKQCLLEACGEERGMTLADRYGDAFPAGYREDTPPRLAVQDIERIEALIDQGNDQALALYLYRPLEAPSGQLRFKICRLGAPVLLSDSLPMLEHLGVKVLEERPARIEPRHGATVWLHDFGLACPAGLEPDLADLRPRFEAAFQAVWRGRADSDDFNRLILLAGLNWREALVLRAYARHMKLAGFPYSKAFKETCLAAHPELARRLIEVFHLRFNPDQEAAPEGDRARRQAETVAAIEAELEQVANLDEDRTLRQFLAMILATLRCNFHQRRDGEPKPYLAVKLEPQAIPGLPEPRPMFEIFVYSPRFEGVHLRGGKVARGGLRWSDRLEDFRTEVLGLMKAQMVKNTVIVPVGSKGGFVIKQAPPPSQREAWLAEGVACYQEYLRGLLDLTDNLKSGRIVPPPDLVRHDGDDPYLVVAADKGTASFSDYANGVSAEYGFWLGDAFASGGSQGYDHKKMAITARGAWESVKRHGRELGIDTQSQPFTVVGIGDMSGDVFGNGMLLSPHIRLVAAFDHRHIFINPAPDSAADIKERQRLFLLPRSSWDDYDKALISSGGGIWPRSAKSIPVAPEVRQVLGIAAEHLTPAELIHAILLAPVDLLYNGGIGTYVKASSESHAAVGDKANDAIRADGAELRCRAVCEGGNLGFTQLGRIEYALKGGRIFTDAIDNSAGVDCSDHEVNIKILLNHVVAEGDLTEKQRNQLLAAMTDDVAGLVLADNIAQTRILSLLRERAPALVDEHSRYLRKLGNSGRLNRKIEFLPFDEELARRKSAKQGLSAPELAVLLAYAKIELYDLVLASDLPEDALPGMALAEYFPPALRQTHAGAIVQHPLKREIITTCLINQVINRAGPTFIHQLQEETGAEADAIIRAFLLARQVFDLEKLWQTMESAPLSHVAFGSAMDAIEQLLRRAALWFLRRPLLLADMSATVARFKPGIASLRQELASLMPAETAWPTESAPADLAPTLASLPAAYAALELVEIADSRSLPKVARLYFDLGRQLDLPWLQSRIQNLPSDSHWDSLARTALLDDLAHLQRELTAAVLAQGSGNDIALDIWLQGRPTALNRCRRLMTELRSARQADLAMLSVLARELRTLAQAVQECPKSEMIN